MKIELYNEEGKAPWKRTATCMVGTFITPPCVRGRKSVPSRFFRIVVLLAIVLNGSINLCFSAVAKTSEYSICELHDVAPISSGDTNMTSEQVLTYVNNDTPEYKDDEGNVHIYRDNFHFKLYSEPFLEEVRGAEVFPGWEHQEDITQLFPDGIIEIPSGIEYDGEIYNVVAFGEFGGLKGITEFILPPTLKRINNGALERNNMTSIEIPDNVTEIGYWAFSECKNLTTVSCGKNLSNISGSAFRCCDNLKTFVLDPTNNHLKIIKNFIVDNDGQGIVCFNRGNRHLEIPAGIESLAEDVCRWDCTIESVSFNEGFKKINKYVFMECSNLREVNLPESLEEIEWGAFSNTAIEELIVPDNVWWLADCVEDCPLLKRIHIGKGTKWISNYGPGNSGCGHRIAKGSNNLEKITVDPVNQWFIADEIGLYTKQKYNLSRIIPTLPIVDLSKSEVTALGSDAASYATHTQIVLPEHIKIIDGRPFEGTSLIQPIHLPYTMTNCNWDITYGYQPRDIYYHSNIPHPYLSDDEFMEYEGITMHVPKGKKEIFANNHSYSHFNIVDDLPEQKLNCIDFGYQGDRFSNMDVGTNTPPAEGAILIKGTQLRAYEGMQITGVTFENSFSESAYAFIERLSTGERLAFKQVMPLEQSATCHIRFSEPYTIQPDDEDILVGIGFNDCGNFAYSRMINPVGNYWREIGESEWRHGDPSSMTCQPTDNAWMWTVSIEGEKLPVDGRLMNIEVEQDIFSKIYKISGVFNNMSGFSSSEVDLTYKLVKDYSHNQHRLNMSTDYTEVANGLIKLNINTDPMRAVAFNTEITMPEENNLILILDVASINGVKDDVPENSFVYLPVNGFGSTDSISNISDEQPIIEVVRLDTVSLLVSGLNPGDPVEVATLDGINLFKSEANDSELVIPVMTDKPIIVKVGDIQKVIL